MSWANLNVLPLALSIIPPTPFQYRKALTTPIENEFGQIVDSYGPWIDAYGIVVPMDEHNEHTEGIDFSKRTMTVYIKGVTLNGSRNQTSPDQVKFDGLIYNVISTNDWLCYDNFRSCNIQEVTNINE